MFAELLRAPFKESANVPEVIVVSPVKLLVPVKVSEPPTSVRPTFFVPPEIESLIGPP